MKKFGLPCRPEVRALNPGEELRKGRGVGGVARLQEWPCVTGKGEGDIL